MKKEVFAGRTVLKRLFKEFFNKTIEDEKDSRSFLSFGKQREQDTLSPKIILFSGENGLGKSSTLNQCIDFAQEIAVESKKSLKIVSFDCEDWFFRKGCLPATIKELMDAIVETASEKKVGLANSFTRYNELKSKVENLSKSVESTITENWSRELFIESTLDQSSLHESCEIWARKKLPKQDFDLVEKFESKAAEAITTAFIEASAEDPLIISIDSIELLNSELLQWVQKQFLSGIFEKKSRILSIISGSGSFIRGIRSTFPEESIFTFNFNDLTLTTLDITSILSKLRLNISDDDIIKIEKYSAGIPVVVQDIIDYIDNKTPLDSILISDCSEVSDSESLAGEIVQRFFSNEQNETIKERVFHLCMCNQFTPALLAKIWNVSYSDVNNCVNEIALKHSFVRDKKIHSSVRKVIRAHLIQQIASGSNSNMSELFNNYSAISFEFFQDQIAQLTTTLPVLEKRYNDERYCSVVISLLTNILWTSPEEAFSLLPGFFLEMIHFNVKCAIDLLLQFEEFRQILSPSSQEILDKFKKGVYAAKSSSFRNRIPVSDYEKDLLSYVNGCMAVLNNERKALLHHSIGRLDFRTYKYNSALNNFKMALSLVENIENERDLFLEDFLMLGYGFLSESMPEFAVDSFSHALKVSPDSFHPWFDMGSAYVSMGKFEEAIDALNNAVIINPDHQDSWYSLGICNSRLENHSQAVESFTKAVEKGPHSEDLWYEMGYSFQCLDQHEDAVKAYGKVVGINPDNADAWFLMGKSNSALINPTEAVSSYEMAINLRGDYLEAIEALGMEYASIKQFSDAAETLEKAAQLQPENSDLWYRISDAWFNADKFDNAIAAGQKAVEFNSNNAGAYVIIGRSYTSVSSFQYALDAFMKACEIEPLNADVWNEIGNNYYAQGNYTQAIGAYYKVIDLNPSHVGTWHSVGLAHQIQEQFELSVEAFAKAIEIQPEDKESWFQKGRVHMALDQHESAIEAFSKTVELTPDSHDAWYRRGLSYAKTQKHQEAVESFVKAVELYHSDSDIWYNLGLSYAALGYHDEAVQAFTEAKTIAPSRFELHHNLGLSLQALAKYNEAIESYTQALELQPDKSESISAMAQCLYHLSRYEEAKSYYLKVFDSSKNDTDNLYYLALTCHAIGEYQEAIDYYTYITNIKPEFTDAWFNTAIAHHAIGNYSEAINIYTRIVDKNPHHGAAWYNLGIAYHVLGELNKAIRSYREASKIDTQKADIWFQMGIAFQSLEHNGEAIQAYRKVIQIDPIHTEAFYNLGLSYYMWNNYEDAISSFKKTVELQPDHFGAWSNLVLSYFENGNYQGTIESTEPSITLKPDEHWLYAYLIVSYVMIGNLSKANEQLDILLTSDFGNEDISRTHYMLKKEVAKKPIEGVDVILKKLDDALQAQTST